MKAADNPPIMLIIMYEKALKYEPFSMRSTVSILKVDIVVNEPITPVPIASTIGELRFSFTLYLLVNKPSKKAPVIFTISVPNGNESPHK